MAERVWDKYLTEQDKAHLSARGKREKKIFGPLDVEFMAVS